MNRSSAEWNEGDTAKAHSIWTEYQRNNDLSRKIDQTAGIDPVSGRVWFGPSAKDIVLQREAEGIRGPVFFLRVGHDYYARKGGRR